MKLQYKGKLPWGDSIRQGTHSNLCGLYAAANLAYLYSNDSEEEAVATTNEVCDRCDNKILSKGLSNQQMFDLLHWRIDLYSVGGGLTYLQTDLSTYVLRHLSLLDQGQTVVMKIARTLDEVPHWVFVEEVLSNGTMVFGNITKECRTRYNWKRVLYVDEVNKYNKAKSKSDLRWYVDRNSIFTITPAKKDTP